MAPPAGPRRSVVALAFAAALLVALSGCLGASGVDDVDEVLYPDGSGGVSAQSTTDEAGAGGTETTDDGAASETTEAPSESGTVETTTSTPEDASATDGGDTDADTGDSTTEPSSSSTSGESSGSSSGSSDTAGDSPTTTEVDDSTAAECDRDVTRDDQSVRVLSCEMERHDDGSVTIEGTLANEGDEAVYDPGVFVRPYDADGEMIQDGAYELFGHDLPGGPIEPGGTADYRVTFEDGDAIDDVEVAGIDDAEAGLYESVRNVYWKAFDDVRREADDVLSQYAHQDSNGLVVYGQAERIQGLYDVTFTVTVETGGGTVEKQVNAGDADEDGEVTFAVYFPDVTDDGYEARVTGHGYTEP